MVSSSPANGMTAVERRAAFSLAAIYALRMLGLFMILPVFAIYGAGHLEHATPLLIGLAIGAYGLTNAIFQIPFGMLSDRYGRKPIIAFGLLLFAIGSVVAASSTSIYGVILGRILQGSGAVAAAVMALAADLTREEHRLRVMAIIGMTIGLSFSASLVLGPLLSKWIGVPGIFWLTAVLALGGIAVLKFAVPVPKHSRLHRDAEAVPAQFSAVLHNRQLLLLNFGIFALHMILTASFIAVPLALHDQIGLDVDSHWMVYLGVQVIAMGLMVPFVIIAEKHRKMKRVFLACVILIAISQLGLAWGYHSLVSTLIFLQIFFLAFNILEATLPSLVAKTAPPDKKGTAMGIYSTTQFLGAFVGGALGGWLHGFLELGAVFLLSAFVAALWAILALRMQEPRYLSNYSVNVGPLDEVQARDVALRIGQVQGVVDVVMEASEGQVYLKVDLAKLDRIALGAFSVAEA